MAERGDLTVLHEPFCNLKNYGETDVGGRTLDSAAQLLAWLRGEAHDRDVFFKDTMDHQYDEVLADRPFLAEARHAFLIRRPEEVAASYYALFPPMTINAIGMERLCEMQAAISDAGGNPPVVIDSDDLVARPAATMAAYCTTVGLSFNPRALTWERGTRPSGSGPLVGTRTLAAAPVSSGANEHTCTPLRTPRSSHGTPPITGPFTSSFMHSG
jgi:Sulfotransferase domain